MFTMLPSLYKRHAEVTTLSRMHDGMNTPWNVRPSPRLLGGKSSSASTCTPSSRGSDTT